MKILSQECGQMLKSTTVSKNTTMNLFLGQLNKRESRKGNWKLVPLCLTGFFFILFPFSVLDVVLEFCSIDEIHKK